MKKKLTLWILLLPFVVLAQQTEFKDGALTIDFGKKKKQQDTTQTLPSPENEEEEPAPRAKKKKGEPLLVEGEEEKPDYKNEGIFKALFIAGLNLSQIDGDEQAGYNQPGAHVGVGALVKFHKNFSASMEIVYGMKGAYKRLDANQTPQYRFRQSWDYIQVPLMLNVHDKKIVMASVGLSLNYLIRNRLVYEVFDPQGNVSDSLSAPGFNALNVAPRAFDLGGVAAFQFLIKRVFGIGLRFEYSLIGLKPSLNPVQTRIRQMHNNSVTVRFMYILNPVKKKR